MTKPTTAKDPVVLRDLSLNDIFPCNKHSVEELKDNDKINQAYSTLFKTLIPRFDEQVQFVLAEVLEIDRKQTGSRLLVYSDMNDKDRKSLIKKYKDILNGLKDDSDNLISENNAFYVTSKIWCAETQGNTQSPENNRPRGWAYPEPEKITDTGTEIETEIGDIADQEREIDTILRRYVKELRDYHLKDYPFSYVLLVPVVLNSILHRQKCRKLGAVFLHFATTQKVENIDLQRIYGRTVLFWHYYFTSEAIDLRQSKLEEHAARAGIYEKIKPFINEIQKSFRDIRQPLRRLETELNPIKGLFDSEDLREFFSINGRTVKLGDDLPEISPRHDWEPGHDETFKKIVAGSLIKVLNLEKQITCGDDLWGSALCLMRSSPERLPRLLLESIPGLQNSSPDSEQVESAFSLVKSWFSDSYKFEKPPGLPLNMLEFALKFWESEYKIENANELSHFWVASRSPVETIDALATIHASYKIKRADLQLNKVRVGIARTPYTSCELKLKFSLTANKKISLTKLADSLSGVVQTKEEPQGDMTTFLWRMGGASELNLKGTKFRGKKKDGDWSIEFMDSEVAGDELKINWLGREYV